MDGVKELQLATVSDPMMQIVELASNPAMDVEKLQRLIDMRKDAMRDNAVAAFNAGFTRMQADLPTVIERSRTDKYSYAALEDIVETVRPVLSRHGFGLSHRTEFLADGKLRVVGILVHEQGHSRESEFITAPDTGPGRNAIQAQGSANQYSRRYTTKDLLNIVTKEEDDDGQKAGAVKKPERAVPAGFDDWLLDLEATSETGTAALQDMWTKSANECRRHLMATDKPKWDALKKRAEKAS
jgi:hypothetical protein